MPERYRYEGDARQLAAAGPEATHREVRRIAPYSRLTTLVAQACHGDRPDAERAAILAEAERHLAPLRAAVRAAQAVLAEARKGLGLEPPPPPPPAAKAEKGRP